MEQCELICRLPMLTEIFLNNNPAANLYQFRPNIFKSFMSSGKNESNMPLLNGSKMTKKFLFK